MRRFLLPVLLAVLPLAAATAPPLPTAFQERVVECEGALDQDVRGCSLRFAVRLTALACDPLGCVLRVNASTQAGTVLPLDAGLHVVIARYVGPDGSGSHVCDAVNVGHFAACHQVMDVRAPMQPGACGFVFLSSVYEHNVARANAYAALTFLLCRRSEAEGGLPALTPYR